MKEQCTLRGDPVCSPDINTATTTMLKQINAYSQRFLFWGCSAQGNTVGIAARLWAG
jgi:hypothetical protein